MTQEHDYGAALEDFDVADILRDRTVETIRHALTTLQAITSALPEGVDPVRLVKGLAGEPTIEMHHEGTRIILSADYVPCSHVFKAMRAQLYREAREVEG